MNTITSIVAVTVATLGLASSSVATQTVQEVPQVIVQEVPQKTFKEKLLEAKLSERRVLLKDKLIELAEKHNVNYYPIYSTIAHCENTAIDPNLQSGHRYKYDNSRWNVKAGQQEKSYGLAMIHLPSHPTITYAQATDPEFALEWTVKEFAKGKQNQWTCYRMLFANK